ncbi:4a-hydroxytetrahydrobiopterin dehydratase [Haliangium ochraceum]|nr:4a-hydroxytetrahydrobiopterin dehydratase [Haliangium ochraceum]
MSQIRKLTREEIDSELAKHPAWSLADDKLHRELRFASFVEAFAFMSGVAVVAESMNHHPEWFNVYNRVSVDLSTHDVSGISERDFALAARIDEIAGRLSDN